MSQKSIKPLIPLLYCYSTQDTFGAWDSEGNRHRRNTIWVLKTVFIWQLQSSNTSSRPTQVDPRRGSVRLRTRRGGGGGRQKPCSGVPPRAACGCASRGAEGEIARGSHERGLCVDGGVRPRCAGRARKPSEGNCDAREAQRKGRKEQSHVQKRKANFTAVKTEFLLVPNPAHSECRKPRGFPRFLGGRLQHQKLLILRLVFPFLTLISILFSN